MPKHHRQLTYEQRCQIMAFAQACIRPSEIARRLGVHRSTIGRELARYAEAYDCKAAQAQARGRRAWANRRRRKLTKDLRRRIERKLIQGQWSPEQICGWLRRKGAKSLSHEAIYRHIWRDKKRGGTLYVHLRHGGKKYNKRKGKNRWRGKIPGRIDIDCRPAIVQHKSRIGDWEGDTICGTNRQAAILSHVERKSKLVCLHRIPAATSANTTAATLADLRIHRRKVLTITYDNGSEFAGHRYIARSLKADIFFAKPYHAWQRGLNEHTNGLVRQYFPKGTDFNAVTDQQVKQVEKILNCRPRKVLQYKTPYEVFYAATIAT